MGFILAEQILVIDLGLVVLLALAMGVAFSRFRQSSALGYVLAGLVLGPLGLKYLVPGQGLSSVFGELGIIMIMFYLGLELNIRKFRETGLVSFVLAAAQMAASFAGGFIVGKLFGFSDLVSIVFGSMVVATSTVIVARFMMERNIIEQVDSRIALSILMLQDFFGIFTLVFFTSLSSQGSLNTIVLNALLFMVGMFFIVSKVSRHVLNFLHTLGHGNKMVFYAIGVGVVVSYAGVLLGLSSTLGAYFAGFALAETAYGDKIKRELGFFREFFVLFFFVAFGSAMFYDYSALTAAIPPMSQLAPLFALTAALVLIHFLASAIPFYFAGVLMGIDRYAAGNIAMLLIPLGEFVILIASATRPLLDKASFDIVTATAFLLILFSAPLQTPLYDNSRRATDFFFSLLPRRLKAALGKGSHSVKKLESVLDSPALRDQYVLALRRVATQVVIALSIVYLSVLLNEKAGEAGISVPFLPPKLSAGAVVLFLVVWPLYKVVLELRFLVEVASRNLIHSAFPAVRRSSLMVEDEVADVFTGVLLTIIGILATVFAFYAFSNPLYLIAPAAYTVLSLMNLSRAFYSLIERYEAAGDLTEDEPAEGRQKEIYRMSREFDANSRKIRAIHSERERMRERVRDAIRRGDWPLVRSLLTAFRRREERILGGIVSGAGRANVKRPLSSRDAFEEYLLSQAADIASRKRK